MHHNTTSRMYIDPDTARAVSHHAHGVHLLTRLAEVLFGVHHGVVPIFVERSAPHLRHCMGCVVHFHCFPLWHTASSLLQHGRVLDSRVRIHTCELFISCAGLQDDFWQHINLTKQIRFTALRISVFWHMIGRIEQVSGDLWRFKDDGCCRCADIIAVAWTMRVYCI